MLQKRAAAVLRAAAAQLAGISPVKYFAVFSLGFCLLFRFGSPATGENPIYTRMGDVNGDLRLTAADVFSLAKITGENAEKYPEADINSDGKISAADVLALIRLLGGSAETVDARSVRLSEEAVTLYLGNQNSAASLSAALSPKNASVDEIVWSSTDEGVVRVDNGRLTAVGEGEAYAVAASGDGLARAACLVKVGVGVTGISFPTEEIYIAEDSAPLLLSPVITPENATNRSLVWQSSDWNIVGVDLSGAITPHQVGTAVIGASSVEGRLTAALTVHVLPEADGFIEENAPDISAQRANKTGEFTNYLNIGRTLNSMLDIQCRFYNVSSASLSSAAAADEVAGYVNPEAHCTGAEKYQFLDLSVPNKLSAEALNKYLGGKGILSGKGQAFIDAANEYGVSEAYLVAHACLETGNGTSQLARGVEYGGVTVYNMFGIGAFDGNALRGGAAYAHSMGWTTPEAAIGGGAEWIAKNYIYRSRSRQNTLYKMRWNPLSPGSHQYATDVGWAVKQSRTIAKIIGGTDCLKIFEIPVYSGAYTGYVPDIAPTLDDSYTRPPEQASPEQASPEQTMPEQASPEPEPTAPSDEPLTKVFTPDTPTEQPEPQTEPQTEEAEEKRSAPQNEPVQTEG